jgi:hypothetical protein
LETNTLTNQSAHQTLKPFCRYNHK